MNFLKLMHTWNESTSKWMFHHPWKNTLYCILYSIIGFTIFWYGWWTLGTLFLFGPMMSAVAMMFCSTIYLVKTGYKPSCCDKCGQVLPPCTPVNDS